MYLIPQNYKGKIATHNFVKLPNFINNCSPKEIEIIQFTFKPIDSTIPVTIEISQFHSKYLENNDTSKKYSLFRFFK